MATITTPVSSVSATAAVSTKFIFTYDHVNHKIVGTDVNFQKAGIPGSKEEVELMTRIEARPDYTFMVLETAKKQAKRTYKGLNTELIKNYIGIQNDVVRDVLEAQLNKMIEDKASFSTIKSWFLDEFKNFNVNRAETQIKEHKLSATKAKIKLIKVAPKTSSNVTDFPMASNQ